MAKYQMHEKIAEIDVQDAKLGSDTVANAGNLVDEDVGKFVKLAADSRYSLAIVGDPIEGTLVSVESASIDGYSFGSIGKRGKRSVICDGLQATPATGTIAVGDYVVVGTPVAAGTALGTGVGPKVCKATYQPGTLADGLAKTVLSFPIDLANITADGDVVTEFTPGFAFEVESVEFVVNTPVTTAGDAADLNVEIDTTDVTGGVVSLTSAACTPLGAVIAGTAVTAANTGAATDTISILATSVTAFAEGSGVIQVTLKNLDTYNTIDAMFGGMCKFPGWRVVALGVAGAVGDTAVIEYMD